MSEEDKDDANVTGHPTDGQPGIEFDEFWEAEFLRTGNPVYVWYAINQLSVYGSMWAAHHGVYEHGEGGLPKDYGQAAAWYLKAAHQNDSYAAIAQILLGQIYEKGGYGVPQDYVQAYKWYDIGAAHKSFDAEKGCPIDDPLDNNCPAALQRDLLAVKMTQAQITEAERLSRGWKPLTPAPSQSNEVTPVAPMAIQKPRPDKESLAEAPQCWGTDGHLHDCTQEQRDAKDAERQARVREIYNKFKSGECHLPQGTSPEEAASFIVNFAPMFGKTFAKSDCE